MTGRDIGGVDHGPGAAQEDLEALLRAARGGPAPEAAFLARVLADAEAVQDARGARAPAVAGPRRGRLARALDLLGGWGALGGLASAAAAGLWIGAAQGSALGDWLPGQQGALGTVELLPDWGGQSDLLTMISGTEG